MARPGRARELVTRWMGWAMAGLLACAAGCGWVGGRSGARGPDGPALLLDARLDKATYQPGEAVVCSLKLANAGPKALKVASLGADTVEFWFGPGGTDLRFKRIPVRSSKEPACEALKLAPKKSTRRCFVLPDVTQEEGVQAIHAFCRPPREEKEKSPSPCYIAPAVVFRVDGAVRFRRDREGVLLGDQAVAVAKEWAKRPVEQADAALIRNEAGYLDWWVTLDLGAKAEPRQRAVLVSAHTGAVRSEARPRPQAVVVGK